MIDSKIDVPRFWEIQILQQFGDVIEKLSMLNVSPDNKRHNKKSLEIQYNYNLHSSALVTAGAAGAAAPVDF